jgi:hypothetical protein
MAKQENSLSLAAARLGSESCFQQIAVCTLSVQPDAAAQLAHASSRESDAGVDSSLIVRGRLGQYQAAGQFKEGRFLAPRTGEQSAH